MRLKQLVLFQLNCEMCIQERSGGREGRGREGKGKERKGELESCISQHQFIEQVRCSLLLGTAPKNSGNLSSVIVVDFGKKVFVPFFEIFKGLD